LAKNYPVVLRYTKEEVTELFKIAHAEDVGKGGRYDLRGAVIYLWPNPQVSLTKRRKPKPMGAFYFQMRNHSGIWKIYANRGVGLADLLYELWALELKALGQVKHGRAGTSNSTLAAAQPEAVGQEFRRYGDSGTTVVGT